jgi:hypothetical protein
MYNANSLIRRSCPVSVFEAARASLFKAPVLVSRSVFTHRLPIRSSFLYARLRNAGANLTLLVH